MCFYSLYESQTRILISLVAKVYMMIMFGGGELACLNCSIEAVFSFLGFLGMFENCVLSCSRFCMHLQLRGPIALKCVTY